MINFDDEAFKRLFIFLIKAALCLAVYFVVCEVIYFYIEDTQDKLNFQIVSALLLNVLILLLLIIYSVRAIINALDLKAKSFKNKHQAKSSTRADERTP